MALSSLAVHSREQGQDKQAAPLVLRAVQIWEQALGPEHAEVAPALANRRDLARSEALPAGRVVLSQGQ